MRGQLHSWYALLFGLLFLLPARGVSSGDPRLADFAPRLADVPPPKPVPALKQLDENGHLVPWVRTATYGGWLEPHPLIEEATLALVQGLSPFADGIYVTSLSRAPADQRRLMRESRYRGWTVKRSKHLLGGFAVDLGFVNRKVGMRKLEAEANQVLREQLGPEKARLLRVVREAFCIHIEISSVTGRHLIQQRTEAMVRWGILKRQPDQHVVPSLWDYVPEQQWLAIPKNPLLALPF